MSLPNKFYSPFVKYIGRIDPSLLWGLIENDVDLLHYEPSAKWIRENIRFLKGIYFFIPKNFDFDEVVEELRGENIKVYKLIRTTRGRVWLAKQMWIMKGVLEG